MPQALDDLGGWTNRDSVAWFADYAALVARRYGNRVTRFATFNEPSIFTLFGQGFGEDENSDDLRRRAIHHINLAHGAAVDAIRAHAPGSSIGGIHNYQPCLPSTPADAQAAALGDAYWNRVFPDPQHRGAYPELLRAVMEPHMQPGDMERICRPLDWFGLNHYGPNYIKADAGWRFGFGFGDKPAGTALTPIGWATDSDAFRDTLLIVSKDYRLPVYVTENGMGGADKPDARGAIIDNDRIDYLRDHIAAMNAAAAAGADVRGYFVWSLLDNFEWDSGYAVRFGITYIDYPTLRRIPKASFEWYRGLITAARSR
jgi:beta-glucosidase